MTALGVLSVLFFAYGIIVPFIHELALPRRIQFTSFLAWGSALIVGFALIPFGFVSDHAMWVVFLIYFAFVAAMVFTILGFLKPWSDRRRENSGR